MRKSNFNLDEIDYNDGFNAGYLISKYEPELIPPLLKAKGQHPYVAAIADGHKEYEKEKFRERFSKKDKGREQGD
jgi:hypothetical protein